VYHNKVIDIIRTYGNQPFCTVADICDDVIELRRLISAHRQSSEVDAASKEIHETWSCLLYRARTLRLDTNPCVRAASSAIQLVLQLSWDPEQNTALGDTAEELKEAICLLPARSCLFMDVTSCQLMLGAVAAYRGSQTRAWFVAKLRRAVVALRARGYTRPQDILAQGIVAEPSLMDCFGSLWEEVNS
jgi:hypothetical protein